MHIITPLVMLRLGRGLTQSEVVARMGGGDRGWLSRFERGLVPVSDAYLERYAKALGVPPRTVRRALRATVQQVA